MTKTSVFPVLCLLLTTVVLQAQFFRLSRPLFQLTEVHSETGVKVPYYTFILDSGTLSGVVHSDDWFVSEEENCLSIRKRYEEERVIQFYVVEPLSQEETERILNLDQPADALPGEEPMTADQIKEARRQRSLLEGITSEKLYEIRSNEELLIPWALHSCQLIPFKTKDILSEKVSFRLKRPFRINGYIWEEQIPVPKPDPISGIAPSAMDSRVWAISMKPFQSDNQERYLVVYQKVDISKRNAWKTTDELLYQFRFSRSETVE